MDWSLELRLERKNLTPLTLETSDRRSSIARKTLDSCERVNWRGASLACRSEGLVDEEAEVFVVAILQMMEERRNGGREL